MRFSIVPRRLRHVPLMWWLAVIVLAVLTGTVVSNGVAQAQASAARYANAVNVQVAKHQLPAGAVITADDFTTEE